MSATQTPDDGPDVMNHLLEPLSVGMRGKTDGASENGAQSTNDRYRCGADEDEKPKNEERPLGHKWLKQ